MKVWRIATDTPSYTADDLSGAGAKTTGGRWNSAGNAVLYSSTSIALAVLETVIHLSAGALPLNRYLVRIDIPSKVWTRRQVLTASTASVGWDAIPEGRISIQTGDVWLTSMKSAILVVPSVVVPEEANVLINPNHPDASAIKATKLRRWLYDARFT